MKYLPFLILDKYNLKQDKFPFLVTFRILKSPSDDCVTFGLTAYPTEILKQELYISSILKD